MLSSLLFSEHMWPPVATSLAQMSQLYQAILGREPSWDTLAGSESDMQGEVENDQLLENTRNIIAKCEEVSGQKP